MIDERLETLDEPDRMRQAGVNVEGGFVLPARVNVEQRGIACRPIDMIAKAARFLAGRRADLAQRRLDLALVAETCMNSCNDEELHSLLPAQTIGTVRHDTLTRMSDRHLAITVRALGGSLPSFALSAPA